MGSVDYANERGNRKLSEIFFRLAVASALPVGKDKTLLNPIFHDYWTVKSSKKEKFDTKSLQPVVANPVIMRVW